jgi:LPS export ABC transporter protein LptC
MSYKKKVQKFRAVLLCLSLLIILVSLGVAIREKKKQIVIKSDAPRTPAGNGSVKLDNVSYTTTNKDNVKACDLKAGSATYYEDNKTVLLTDVDANLYDSDSKIYHITGNFGEFDTETRNIVMKTRIKAILPDKTEIQTESVFYDHEKRIITTEDKILIKRGKSIMEGLGMILDLDKQKFTVPGKVKVLGE